MPLFNLQAVVDSAIQQTVDAAAADEALDEAAIAKLKADCTTQLEAALEADAAADAAEVKAKDELIGKLNTRIQQLEADLRLCLAQTPPEYALPITTPPPTTTPATAPPAFPDATNTGVPAGTVLKPSGTVNVTEAGAVISGLDITGYVYVMAGANNVVIENCRITSGAYQGVNMDSGVTGTTVRHCEINGQQKVEGSYGIYGIGTFEANHIYGFENGIGMLAGKDIVVRGNYIHDLMVPGSDPHIDGIACQGGQDGVLIEGNTVVSWDTSCVFVKGNFGTISNVTINRNRLLVQKGRPLAYCINVDGRAEKITNLKVTNNQMEKAAFGYWTFDHVAPTRSGNTDLAGNSVENT
jgi:hypothetical protein